MDSATLPPFAPFPSAAWKDLLSIDEWNASLLAWVSLAEAHLSLDEARFPKKTLHDESVPVFLSSYMREVAVNGATLLGTSPQAKTLMKACFRLTDRILAAPSPPLPLLQWEFLSDFSRIYTKRRVSPILTKLLEGPPKEAASLSLAALKKYLIKNLDEGIKGDLKTVEARLRRLNYLIHASTDTASFFLAGSEFLDGLINCYKIMNPPLRKVIITTTYLSLIGLVESDPPKFSMLTDQLYSLKTAAEAHKAGPTSANDSLVPELVSTTPLLQQLEHKLEASGVEHVRAKKGLRDLATWKKPGAGMRPKKLVRRKIDKGKGVAQNDDHGAMAMNGDVHMHRMSQITQIQDLFPELGAGFVLKLLDEYSDNSEQVIAHLLEDSLPLHLKNADHSEQISNKPRRRRSSLLPRLTPPMLPLRRNDFDNDDLVDLALDTSKLHIGKRDGKKTADDILADRSTAPNKAAILSALANFDLDDDERDDTYDAADVGGTVDTADTEAPADDNEEVLWKAYQADPKLFGRDQATRGAAPRSKLKSETGMTDEAIEGWAIILSRDANQKRRLELKYSAANAFTGQQAELASTAWRADRLDPDGDSGSNRGGRGGNRGRGGGRGRGGRGGGNVAGPTGEQETEQARRKKEANKSQRANHNRREQRARKMARGGFPG